MIRSSFRRRWPLALRNGRVEARDRLQRSVRSSSTPEEDVMKTPIKLKKLHLNRETIRELTDRDLKTVVGGEANYPPIPPTGCDNTGLICDFSERTCCFDV
jgi:hypothetical protein